MDRGWKTAEDIAPTSHEARPRATNRSAAHGLTDITHLAGLLQRAEVHIRVRRLARVSPLAVPMLLNIGRESVRTATDKDTLLEETEALIAEVTGGARVGEKERQGLCP